MAEQFDRVKSTCAHTLRRTHTSTSKYGDTRPRTLTLAEAFPQSIFMLEGILQLNN